MTLLNRHRGWMFVVCLVVLEVGCGLRGEEATPIPPPPVVTEALPDVGEGTAVGTVVEGGERATADSEGAAVSTPTLASTVESEGTAVPTVDVSIEEVYRVVHVDEIDILNVRSGPGPENEIVADLAPGTAGVRIVGFGQPVNDSVWVPINVEESSGWVNSRFLTEDIPSEEFCGEGETAALLEALREAIEARDGEALADISNPERGLRFRRYWDSDGVRFENQQVNNVFNLTQSYFWGTADGSGEDVDGSFSEVILPLLDRDLVRSTQTACNEILQGGTAGVVQLPFRYEGVNFYSMHRPAAADNEMDWGTWVVGIERWQGEYFVSFLVHFEWEI